MSKYYSYSKSPEELQEEFANGYEIVVDWLYTDDLIKMIKEGFKEIANKYDLNAHYDNLLMATLQKMIEIEQSLDVLKLQNEQQLRTKQLAALFLTYKETLEKRRTFSALQVNSIANSAKLTDHKAIELILKMLHDGIRDGNFGTISTTEWGLEELFFTQTGNGKVLDTEKLKYEAAKPIESYKKRIKGYHVDFCLHLYNYLDGETNIRPDKTKFLSDQMANFYFDLLVLIEFINPDDYRSDPKDYIRTMLSNRIKKVNH